jgi:anti-sigma factor RsiW
MVTADRAKTAMCGEMEALTQSYVDGELAGRDHETYERHLGECERCRSAVHFARRMKAAVRGHLARRQVSSAFEHRLRVALASQPEAPPRWPWLTWSRAVPALALVGAVVVVVATAQNHHSVSSWFRGRVDFPVHPPKLPAQIRCQGGRLVNVEDRPAAYLVYQDQKGHRLSVLVFDAESAPIEAPIRRMVDGREVFYRGGPGISTVGFHDRGLGYVMTADLDMDSMDGLLQASLH